MRPLDSLKSNFKYILIAISFFVAFAILNFPYGDLSDLITREVAKGTNNQVFLSFDDMGLSIFPVGVNLREVRVETSQAPTIKVSSLSLAPSLWGMLIKKPGFSAHADGIFGGDMKLSVKSGKEVSENVIVNEVSLDISKAEMRSLSKLIKLPVELRGTADLEVDGDIDFNFEQQPETEISIELSALRMLAGAVPTPMGPLDLPTLEFKNILLQGRLVNGELIIEKGVIGSSSDGINGTVTGNVGIQFLRQAGRIFPNATKYNLNIDLNLSNAAQGQFLLFTQFIDKYKTQTGSGTRYPFNISGRVGATPNFGPIRKR